MSDVVDVDVNAVHGRLSFELMMRPRRLELLCSFFVVDDDVLLISNANGPPFPSSLVSTLFNTHTHTHTERERQLLPISLHLLLLLLLLLLISSVASAAAARGEEEEEEEDKINPNDDDVDDAKRKTRLEWQWHKMKWRLRKKKKKKKKRAALMQHCINSSDGSDGECSYSSSRSRVGHRRRNVRELDDDDDECIVWCGETCHNSSLKGLPRPPATTTTTLRQQQCDISLAQRE